MHVNHVCALYINQRKDAKNYYCSIDKKLKKITLKDQNTRCFLLTIWKFVPKYWSKYNQQYVAILFRFLKKGPVKIPCNDDANNLASMMKPISSTRSARCKPVSLLSDFSSQ